MKYPIHYNKLSALYLLVCVLGVFFLPSYGNISIGGGLELFCWLAVVVSGGFFLTKANEKAKVKNLKETAESWKGLAQARKNELEELEQKIEVLRQKVEELEDKVDKLSRFNVEYQEKVFHLERENYELRRKVQGREVDE